MGNLSGTSRRSGAARRRREQQKRAIGRHMAWVTGLLQNASGHHTGSSLGGLFSKVEALEKLVGQLVERINELESRGDAPDGLGQGHPGEAVGAEPVEGAAEGAGAAAGGPPCESGDAGVGVPVAGALGEEQAAGEADGSQGEAGCLQDEHPHAGDKQDHPEAARTLAWWAENNALVQGRGRGSEQPELGKGKGKQSEAKGRHKSEGKGELESEGMADPIVSEVSERKLDDRTQAIIGQLVAGAAPQQVIQQFGKKAGDREEG